MQIISLSYRTRLKSKKVESIISLLLYHIRNQEFRCSMVVQGTNRVLRISVVEGSNPGAVTTLAPSHRDNARVQFVVIVVNRLHLDTTFPVGHDALEIH